MVKVIPPVILAPGQVWRTAEGIVRSVLLLYPDKPPRIPTCQCVIRGRSTIIVQRAMLSWIKRHNAVLAA